MIEVLGHDRDVNARLLGREVPTDRRRGGVCGRPPPGGAGACAGAAAAAWRCRRSGRSSAARGLTAPTPIRTSPTSAAGTKTRSRVPRITLSSTAVRFLPHNRLDHSPRGEFHGLPRYTATRQPGKSGEVMNTATLEVGAAAPRRSRHHGRALVVDARRRRLFRRDECAALSDARRGSLRTLLLAARRLSRCRTCSRASSPSCSGRCNFGRASATDTRRSIESLGRIYLSAIVIGSLAGIGAGPHHGGDADVRRWIVCARLRLARDVGNGVHRDQETELRPAQGMDDPQLRRDVRVRRISTSSWMD